MRIDVCSSSNSFYTSPASAHVTYIEPGHEVCFDALYSKSVIYLDVSCTDTHIVADCVVIHVYLS